jgi:CBS domain-containing protein
MVENVLLFLKPKDDVSFFYDNLSVQDGLDYMKQHAFTSMPVINKSGEYVGSISEGDFLWHILVSDKPTTQTQLSKLIRKDYIPACTIDVSLEDLFQQSSKQNYVPIVDDRNIFIGIVTRQAILAYLMKEAAQIEPIVRKEIEKQNKIESA